MSFLVLISGRAFGQVNGPTNQRAVHDPSRRTHPTLERIIYPNSSDTTDQLILPAIGDDYIRFSQEEGRAVAVIPVFAFEGGYSDRGKGTYLTSGGLAIKAKSGKFRFSGEILGGGTKQPAYLSEFTDSLGILPSFGRNLASKGAAFLLPAGRLAFTPSELFTFELGFGRHFFGNGHRSMFLSDVAYNYPYFKIDTEVWHIKYINLFAWQKDISANPAEPDSYRDKFSSTHYLSWSVSPRFNIGLFETIVWQAEDTLSNRGFDPNYLNPVIFYRPVEFSIGSPDNAIIGLDLSFKLSSVWFLYGQLVFDEFLLSEFRAGDGWWGNKWGAQLGVMATDPFDIENGFLRAEFNLARPFTYTHGSVVQNFGHFNQPLAHILGTNFYEGILQAYYERRKIFAEGQWNFAVYGRDPDTLNLGGDIYRSYVNPAEIYGNEIAQGIRHELFYQRLSAGVVLNRNTNLRASVYYVYRRLKTEGLPVNNEHIFGVRLATELFRQYRDF